MINNKCFLSFIILLLISIPIYLLYHLSNNSNSIDITDDITILSVDIINEYENNNNQSTTINQIIQQSNSYLLNEYSNISYMLHNYTRHKEKLLKIQSYQRHLNRTIYHHIRSNNNKTYLDKKHKQHDAFNLTSRIKHFNNISNNHNSYSSYNRLHHSNIPKEMKITAKYNKELQEHVEVATYFKKTLINNGDNEQRYQELVLALKLPLHGNSNPNKNNSNNNKEYNQTTSDIDLLNINSNNMHRYYAYFFYNMTLNYTINNRSSNSNIYQTNHLHKIHIIRVPKASR